MEREIKNLFDLEIEERKSNSIDTDIKAEVLASALIEKGVDPEYVKIVRDKAFQRNWTKDIEDVEIEYSQSLFRDRIIVRTNRTGLYDILPENIFHKSTARKFNRDKEDVIEEIKRQRREEFYARKFFQLFESVIDDASIQAYLYETKFDKKISNSNFTNVFIAYWPILELLDRAQGIIFLHTIPHLHKIRTQLKEIAQAMSLILNVNVEIEQLNQSQKIPNSNITEGIGNFRLGVDWIVGESFNDGEVDLKLKIGPIPVNDMMDYLEQSSKGYIIVDYLCNLFISGNIHIEKEFIVSSEDANFYLSDKEHITYLGINTFL